MLDFFLRYLRSQYSSRNWTKGYSYDWMGAEDEPLRGFSWRGGSERDTTGILIWSEIFTTVLPGDENVAILIVDTQGTFDSESTVKDCATVFALSTMISSVQIYNLSQNIQEDDLQHLQLFTEYGKLALAESGKKPFQKLEFLVRDWSYPYEADYGVIGGRLILERRLRVCERQHPELQSIRKHIHSCFSEIGCFLMPHPGLKVATSPTFDGKLSDMDDVFKKYLKIFVPMQLAPENLIPKEISGNKVRAKELVQYFKAYVLIYSGDNLPEPKSMLDATAEANHLLAVAEAKDAYNVLMESCCGGSKPFLSTAQLEAEHLKNKFQALGIFDRKKKMGGEEISEKYRKKLEIELEELYSQFKEHNMSKNIFKAARPPSVLFTVMICSYILSGILGFIGLYNLANFFNFTMGLSLLSLLLWIYVRYSGEMVIVGEKIEEFTDVLWELLLKPLYRSLTSLPVEQTIHTITESDVLDSQPYDKKKV
ncbi:atlastin isoform X2 [Halyomorpha halys]